MDLQGRQVLVTGAGGFIGSHLTEALVRAGARTRVLVHYNSRGDWGLLNHLDPSILQSVNVLSGDICDRTLVREAVQGCDTVFHLAALIGIPFSYQAVQSYVSTNVAGTLNVLEACRSLAVRRLVHTSTSEVYGTARYRPMDERHPLHAQSPYAATKIAADQLAYSFFASFGTPVVIVRPFNTFGPRQSARAVIPTIISQALDRHEVELGDTRPVRDFLFVADTAQGFLAAAVAEGVEGEVINLGTGRGVTVGELVQIVARLLGKRLTVRQRAERQRPSGSEVLELVCCAQKARTRLGWQPRVSLEHGLERTIAWLQEHRQWYKPERYCV